MRLNMAESQKRSASRTHPHNHPRPTRVASPAQQIPPLGNTGTPRGPASSPTSSASSSPASPNKGVPSFRFNAVSEERRHLLSRNWRFREWARHGQLNVPVELPEEEECATANQKPTEEDKSKQTDPPKDSDEPPGYRWVTIEIV